LYSELRRQGFVDRAAEAGVAYAVLELPESTEVRQTWKHRVAPLTRWLRGLRPPFGVLAVQDYRARAVMDECQRLGLRIPHDVAVLGIDDDPTVCEYCQPTLSSVSRNSWRLGYETAAMLDRLMAGHAPPAHEVLIPSDGIISRQSTDTVVVEDPQVASAVHFMHDHAGEAFGVGKVVGVTTISRRLLEVRFRKALGSSIFDYLCRLRMERAKRLLARSEPIKLQRVAALCGFASVEQMRLVFTRMAGRTPREYRRTVCPRS
jgi:LacI family transcriptional regulator